MTHARLACAFAAFSILCVLMIFLFPAMQGPYSAVHGPVTALLSMKAAASLRIGIVVAGLGAISTSFPSLPICWGDNACFRFDCVALTPAGGWILRC